MVRNGRRLFPWRWNCCLSVCARELCAVRAVPVIVWRRTRQPRFPPRAFGCVRLAIRRPCTGPLGWRARSSPRLARARGGIRRAYAPRGCLRTLRVRLRRIFPPLRFGAFPRIRLHPRGAIHPPLRRAWLGREASLRQSHPSRRRLAPRGTGFALAPWQARLAPCALSALVRFCGARSAPLTVSKVSALVRNCAESSPFTLSPCPDMLTHTMHPPPPLHADMPDAGAQFTNPLHSGFGEDARNGSQCGIIAGFKEIVLCVKRRLSGRQKRRRSR